MTMQLEGEENAAETHPMLDLLARPNAFHSRTTLLQALIFSWITDANAYWLKRRDSEPGVEWFNDLSGEVRELRWVPHWRMRPRGSRDGSRYITHYELWSGKQGRIRIPIENVIHFRNGIDPARPQYGLSIIYSELREIWTDDEAAAFTAGLLRNVGVPGLVVSPKAWPSGDGDDIEVIPERYIEDRFGGDNRGRALVMQAPTDVTTLGYSPQQMDLSALRNTVEERVCAAIGIPASVVGFATGLHQTEVDATMREQIRLAWTGAIIPLQRAIAEQLALSLLPEFEEDPSRWKLGFDRSGIHALQEDRDELVKRLDAAVRGGWLRVDRAQALAGFEPDESQAIYLRGIGVVEVPAEEVPPTRPLPPSP